MELSPPPRTNRVRGIQVKGRFMVERDLESTVLSVGGWGGMVWLWVELRVWVGGRGGGGVL